MSAGDKALTQARQVRVALTSSKSSSPEIYPRPARAAVASRPSVPPRPVPPGTAGPRPLPGASRFLTRFPAPSWFTQGVGPRADAATWAAAAAITSIPPPPAMAEELSAATSYTEDDFYCPVCQEVLKTPVRTAACQHV
ncbi:hypothetical protein J1605_018013 [Eschrichtius robustus]|uniref:E3 ubiquitin-protein ligase n=1 Tax=Eschrichtius robustus TaxID=9764 RepID=A0AB34HZC2_ESCRO|nr:hypothetical protein J1605_018013 [Eschrichtius robustus]